MLAVEELGRAICNLTSVTSAAGGNGESPDGGRVRSPPEKRMASATTGQRAGRQLGQRWLGTTRQQPPVMSSQALQDTHRVKRICCWGEIPGVLGKKNNTDLVCVSKAMANSLPLVLKMQRCMDSTLVQFRFFTGSKSVFQDSSPRCGLLVEASLGFAIM